MILNVNKMRFQNQIKNYLALMFYFGHTEVKYLNPLDTNGRNVIFVQDNIIQRESKRTSSAKKGERGRVTISTYI
jgi:hypothetical protein